MFLYQKINGFVALLFVVCFSVGTGIFVMMKIEHDVQSLEAKTYTYNQNLAQEIGERKLQKATVKEMQVQRLTP
jgi:hypothetical protein